MKLVISFLRLVRYPNLLFIAATQFLFYFCILSPAVHPDVFLPEEFSLLSLLVLSSVFIAAGGYIINDYFDFKIDLVNKPGQVIVDKTIPRRWAIIWHWIFSAAGVLLGCYISWVTKNWLIAFSNIVCVILLWLYSTTFKKKLLSGNIIISLLTAWVVLVVFFFTDHFSPGLLPNLTAGNNANREVHRRLIRISFLYAGFAFIISLIREVVKDMEDMEGDARYGCKTMPIVWGIPVSKVFTGVWLMVLTGALASIQFYALYLKWWWSIVYCVLFIIAPLLIITKRLYEATTAEQFGKLSGAVKFVMLTGILSMVFFKIYLA
ncbi:MAG: geranylgeranylglycerol-phosphate geranylgeranyltransferase [Chitinophagaceae bacterium]|nr:geranylgeranylglycerol-phosphate geranylgeranyltransferase [Chitinophagaceae bacterium]MCW5926924.1 geranylgeranylglycerol-phosphate geranylgeranyltransferase [Chitinophagaceae bacterium]